MSEANCVKGFGADAPSFIMERFMRTAMVLKGWTTIQPKMPPRPYGV
jgi:hypothetical protein|tara:strand:+ start:1473 stop:1613 length:141 start_codon:yes stop_codon:yes gene_type:complete